MEVRSLRQNRNVRLAPMIALGLVACAGKQSPPPTSAELEQAEARACAGIQPAERASNPLREREILSVQPLVQKRATAKEVDRKVGAIVTVAPRPGLTAEWLQRRVECYAAAARVEGRTNQPDDPLAVPGATTSVSSTGNGFAIAIRSGDPSEAGTIIERADALAPASVARP